MDFSDKSKHWFAARAGNCQEIKARDLLVRYGVDHFIPTKTLILEKRGRKVKVEKSLTGNLVFLFATRQEACAMVNFHGLPVHFIPDRCGGKSMLTIPPGQMEDFRRVFEYSLSEGPDPTMILEAGDRVRIIRGELKGVEGNVLTTGEGTLVAVSLTGLLQARAKVPVSYLEMI